MHGLHDFHDRETALGIKLGAPSFFDRGTDLRVLDGSVIGKEHGNEPGIGGTLHVVLSAQGMQASAGTANLAADKRKRDEAARIVGAMHMLRYAHAPEDDR